MLLLKHNLKEEKKYFYEEELNPDLIRAEKVVKKRTNIRPEELLLSARIRKAFNNVTCPNTRQVLYGGYLYDDYYGKEASVDFYNWLAKKEERNNWEAISPIHLFACDVCLTYLDAESFRFLAPAYMCFSLEYEPDYPVESWLFFFGIRSNSDYADNYYDYYDLFTEEQRQCTQDCMDLWRKDWQSLETNDDSDVISLLPWELDDYEKNYAKSYSIFEYLRENEKTGRQALPVSRINSQMTTKTNNYKKYYRHAFTAVKLGTVYFMLGLLLSIVLEIIYYFIFNKVDIVVAIGSMTGACSLYCIHLSFKFKFHDLILSYCSIFSLLTALCFALYTLLCIVDVQLIGSSNILPMRLCLGLAVPMLIFYFLMASLCLLAYWIHRKISICRQNSSSTPPACR